MQIIIVARRLRNVIRPSDADPVRSMLCRYHRVAGELKVAVGRGLAETHGTATDPLRVA